jgi:hypothetical protein
MKFNSPFHDPSLRLLAPNRRQLVLGATACLLAPLASRAQNQFVMSVGPERAINTIAEAAAKARDGDIIEVEAGDYPGDVAVWTKDDITVRAVGGRVRLMAGGKAAEGKAIWLVRGGRMSVQGFDFSGARVPDHNGAGLRLEKGQLTVQDCSFMHNENGLLTGNDHQGELEIINSEFGYNGYGDGQSHNLYVGELARLAITGSYSHHAKVGHLLKTRAALNHIYYNRLADGIGGTASYELELAIGGVAYVVGNIIEQGSETENPHIISYGAEGYKWPANALYLINNTVVDNRPQGGVFLRIKPGDGSVRAINNVLVGQGKLDSAGPGDYRNNFTVDWDQFEWAARDDFRLKRTSRLVGKAIDPGSVDGQSLMPTREYVDPRSTRKLQGPVRNPGALQSFK